VMHAIKKKNRICHSGSLSATHSELSLLYMEKKSSTKRTTFQRRRGWTESCQDICSRYHDGSSWFCVGPPIAENFLVQVFVNSANIYIDLCGVLARTSPSNDVIKLTFAPSDHAPGRHARTRNVQYSLHVDEFATVDRIFEDACMSAMHRTCVLLMAIDDRVIRYGSLETGDERSKYIHGSEHAGCAYVHLPLSASEWLGVVMSADNSLLAVGNGPNVDLYSVTLSDDGSVKLHTYYAPLARFDINHVQPALFSEWQRSVSMLHR